MVKNINLAVGVSAVLLGVVASSAFAAGVVLTNGGLGQAAANQQSFGIAVCNGSAVAINKTVPVTVSANGITIPMVSAPSIAAGQCAYSYVNYNQFNMKAGQSYTVAVTIDPNKTVITNANNQATYTVAVPNQQGTTTAANSSANGNFIAVIGSAFANFFASLKNLF